MSSPDIVSQSPQRETRFDVSTLVWSRDGTRAAAIVPVARKEVGHVVGGVGDMVGMGGDKNRPLPAKHLELFPAGVEWSPVNTYRRRARALYRTLKNPHASDVSDLLLRISASSTPKAASVEETDRTVRRERQRRHKSLGTQLVRDTFALQILGLDKNECPCAVSGIDGVLIWQSAARRLLTTCKAQVLQAREVREHLEANINDILNAFHLRQAFGTFMSMSTITRDENLKQHRTTAELEALLSEFWNLGARSTPMVSASDAGASAKDEFKRVMQSVYMALMPRGLDSELIDNGVNALWLHMAKDDGTLPTPNFFVAIMRTIELFCESPQDAALSTNEATVLLSRIYDAISHADDTGTRVLRPTNDIDCDCLNTGDFPVLPALQASHDPLVSLRQYLEPEVYDQVAGLKYKYVGSVASMPNVVLHGIAAKLSLTDKKLRCTLEDALACHVEGDMLLPELMASKISLDRLKHECDEESLVLSVIDYAKSIGMETVGHLGLLDVHNDDVFDDDRGYIEDVRDEIMFYVDMISRLPVFSRLKHASESLRLLLSHGAQLSFFLREWQDPILDLLDDEPDLTLGEFCMMDTRQLPFVDKNNAAMRELRRTLISYLANVSRYSSPNPGQTTRLKRSGHSPSVTAVDLTVQAKENLGDFFEDHTTPRRQASTKDLTSHMSALSLDLDALSSVRSTKSNPDLQARPSTGTTRRREATLPRDPNTEPSRVIPGFPMRHLPSGSRTPRGSRKTGGRYEAVLSLEDRLVSNPLHRLQPKSSIPTFVQLPRQHERIPVSPKVPPAIPIGTPRLRPRTANARVVAPGEKQRAEDQAKAARNAIRVKRKPRAKTAPRAKIVYADEEEVEYVDGVEKPSPRRIYEPPPLPRSAMKLKSSAATTTTTTAAVATPPKTPRRSATPRSARGSSLRPSTAPGGRGETDASSRSAEAWASSERAVTTTVPRGKGKGRGRRSRGRNKDKKKELDHLDSNGRRIKKSKPKNPYEYAYADPTKTTTLKWMKNFGSVISGPVFGNTKDDKRGTKLRRKKGQLIDYAAQRRLRRSRVITGPRMDVKSYDQLSHRKKDVWMPSDIRSTDHAISFQ